MTNLSQQRVQSPFQEVSKRCVDAALGGHGLVASTVGWANVGTRGYQRHFPTRMTLLTTGLVQMKKRPAQASGCTRRWQPVPTHSFLLPSTSLKYYNLLLLHALLNHQLKQTFRKAICNFGVIFRSKIILNSKPQKLQVPFTVSLVYQYLKNHINLIFSLPKSN